jgi:hypothetical protein
VTYEYEQQAPRRRRRRTGVWLLVILVVLVGLLVAADRVGAYAAERTIADQSTKQMRQLGVSSSEPEVTVGGFPFLTQVADGTYQEITIVLRDVEKEGVRLPVLDVHATGVNAKINTLISGDGPVTADQITGTATVGYESVRALIELAAQRLGSQGGVALASGVTLSESGGKLQVRLPVTVVGLSFTAVGLGAVSVNGNKVRLTVTELKADGVSIPAQVQRLLDAYKDKLTTEVAVPPLPFRLKIDSVTPRPEGLAISATAQGVPLTT